jgi:uncharacterized protein (TIGR02145 family)
MKKISFLIAILLLTLSLQAQAPQKFSYQTVIRNASNQLLVGQTVSIKISILQGSVNGSAVYAETHTPQTNANGLATLEIGGGTLLSGNFSSINWANGPFFVKTETDPNGGNNYTITNTSQLLSVPYALHSQDVPTSFSVTGDTLYIGNKSYIIPGISQNNNTGSPANCGAINVHNPAKTYGSLTDQEGNVYKTIVIGTQEWMAENLKTSIYRNGNEIANVIDDSQWFGLTTGAWVYPYNESQYECPYGKFYNWYAVSDPRNVCPAGWHIPTYGEWNILINYLDPMAVDGGNYFNLSGGKLKSTGLQYWNSPNQDASNQSGFSGQPGGFRLNGGSFENFGLSCYLWSATESITNNAKVLTMNSSYGSAGLIDFDKPAGLSVRCLRD